MTESYLGKPPVFGDYKKLDDIATQFNGIKTNFSLFSAGSAISIASTKQLLISLDGVILEPEVSYLSLIHI